ncbi:hypothetical protein N7456_003482 [Penicillium angulare]|uniref:Uncharacterized protein n=1 Tax=Penicillium angulare TaxID=116970 RepID=A0A9W9FWG1_9EURO|nr:hypothetical protein N7456_003482 [Penicillium angulare]
MLSFACVYGTIPIWGCLFSESVRPNSLLRNIISRDALSTDRINFEKNTLDSVLDIYEAISRLDHLFHADRGTVLAEVERALSFAKSTQVDVASFRHHLSTSEKLNVCCQISCQLFWEMLRRQFESEKTLNTIAKYETRQLLTRLLQIEPSYWIQNAPEVFAWVAFTGAAASNCSDECVAFISNATTILSAVDGEKLTLLRQGWRYFRLLKRLCGDYNTLDDR